MGVPLCDPNVGVSEDLHYDANVDALFEEQGRRRMPAIVQAGIPDAGRRQERLPFGEVVAWVDGLAVRAAEDEVVVLPGVAGRHAVA